MNILYVITILAIYVLFMLMHKTEKKQNIIMWLTVTTILILCYNVLICTIFNFIGILCTLLNMSIVNSLTIIGLIVYLLKTKKLQKYYVKIEDIIFSILVLIIVIFIAYTHYGFPFNIKYYSTDGSSHYFYAEQFYQNEQLLDKGENEDTFDIYVPQYRLPGAYVNEGILFKIFDGIFLKVDVFIVFDLIVLYMSGILFYNLLRKYMQGSKLLTVVAMIFSLIYMLGYQLESMLEGFVYLSLALDIVITLILLISNYKNEEISNRIILPILALVCFGVFFTYGYFVPIVYISVIVNYVIKAINRQEEVTSIKNIMKLIIVIVIPLVLGMTYFMLLPVINGRDSEISTIGRDGGIYKNYITNFLMIIPILITGLILKIKNRNKDFDYGTVLFILSLLFLFILLIGNKLKFVSNYYYFKVYYIVWPLALYNTFIALRNIFAQKNKNIRIITYSYTGIYIIALFSALILNQNIAINDIFYHNTSIISKEKYISLNRKELLVLNNATELVGKQNLYVVSSKQDMLRRWTYALSKNEKIFVDYYFVNDGDIERWLQFDEKYYIALYKCYNKLKDNEGPEENNDRYKIVYKDENCFVLEKKDDYIFEDISM